MKREKFTSPLGKIFSCFINYRNGHKDCGKRWTHALRVKGPVKEWKVTSEPGETKLTIRRT